MREQSEWLSRHYGSGRQAGRLAEAIAELKASGEVAVVRETRPGSGAGFCAYQVRDGRRGMGIGPVVNATEEQAWLSAALYLARFKPGVVQMTSREFGAVSTPNVLRPDGNLGVSTRRSRLEIRQLDDQYHVFRVERRYLDGDEPKDVRQEPTEQTFATLAQAAGYVGQYIADYEGAAADHFYDAVEAQRHSDRESVR